MIIIRKTDIKILEEYVPDYKKYTQIEQIDELLHEVSKALNVNGFDERDEITDLGRKIQNAYDNIFYDNE